MPDNTSGSITELLIQWCNGDRAAFGVLVPMVEKELHEIARRLMRKERVDHTLQPTALVNETYLRLVDQSQVNWKNRAHFVGIAAHVMRQVLVDYGRRVHRQKRDRKQTVALDEVLFVSAEKAAEFLVLDEALSRLEAFDPRKVKVVELRFFGGLSVEEAAEVLEVHPNTVVREWALAKAWLKREMENELR
jgi:RNA polymerase sigma-70 factor (ECF subfamily)